MYEVHIKVCNKFIHHDVYQMTVWFISNTLSCDFMIWKNNHCTHLYTKGLYSAVTEWEIGVGEITLKKINTAFMDINNNINMNIYSGC